MRLRSIDFIRGFAILAMIQTHVWGVFIAHKNYADSFVYNWLVLPLGGYAAPLFILISGLSSSLAIRSMLERGSHDQIRVRGIFLKRGLLLFCFSTIINLGAAIILRIDEMHWLNWSVFQLIGVCYLIIPFFANWNLTGKILFSTILLTVPMWDSSSRILPAVLLNGFTPLFPWGSLFFFGYMIGDLFSSRRFRTRSRNYLSLIIVGLTLLVISKPLLEYYQIPFNGWDKTLGMNLTSFSVYMGCFLCLLSVIGYRLDYGEFGHPIIDVFLGFGQHALTIYYLQLLGIIGLGAVLRILFTQSAVLNPVWFLPILILVFVGLHVTINIFWKKGNYRFSLEWWLREASMKRWQMKPKLELFTGHEK